MTIVSPEQMISEVKSFGITKKTLNKVRMMQKGKQVFLKFHNPSSGEVIETSVNLQDFMNMEFMNWGPISIPALWLSEIEEFKDRMKQLEKARRLEELNAIPTT